MGLVSCQPMWTAYTREKPARQGWTLLAMACAFAGSLVLAQQIVKHRAGARSSLMGVQSMPDWPIEFELPRDVDWISAEPSSRRNRDGSGSEVVKYMGYGVEHTPCMLNVEYLRVPKPLSPVEAAKRYGGPDREWDERIELASAPAVLSVTGAELFDEQAVSLIAVGSSKEGLIIVVDYHSWGRLSHERAVFEDLCASVRLK